MGRYRILNLQPGKYVVTVDAALGVHRQRNLPFVE